MPPKPKRPCNKVGCPNLTTGRFCEVHTKEDRSIHEKNRHRESAHKRGYTHRWSKARKPFLNQNPLCVECERNGRITSATVVDHIIPHKGDDQLFWDTDNWQSLCKPCHDKKTFRENGGAAFKQGATKPKWLETPACDVVIVWGPPGSGKSTYTAGHRQPADVVIDLDEITTEITGLPIYQSGDEFISPALYERNRRLGQLKNKTSGTAWVILTGTKILDRVWWCEKLQPKKSIVLHTPLNVCIERINNDERRGAKAKQHIAAAKEWHERFLSLDSDRTIYG